jgi:hypothetical protein
MSKKKKRRDKERERAERDKMSLEALNAFRQVNGHKPLQILHLDFNPNLASAPSLVSPSPNEGAPIKRIAGTPIKKKLRGHPIKKNAGHCHIRKNFIRRRGHQRVT